jgi:hypothetical protein
VQEKTPVLSQLINKSNAEFLQVLPSYSYSPSPSIGEIVIPALKKIAPADTSFTSFPYDIQTPNFETKKRYYI